jgi:DNA replication protein DnaC
MEFIFEVCLNYAQKFGRFYFKNLFLSGGTGLGKTSPVRLYRPHVSEKRLFGGVRHRAQRLLPLRSSEVSREAEDLRRRRRDRRYLNCDLLILDDLGSEFTTPSSSRHSTSCSTAASRSGG